MFEGVVNLIKASAPIQLILAFVAGGIVAALFYPTKHIEEKLQKSFQQQMSVVNQQHQQETASQQEQYKKLQTEYQTYHVQSQAKITSLTSQVTSLKSHQKKTYYKIVHPDGTVEVRVSSEKDSDEEQQISQEVQQEYKQQLDSEMSKIEQIQADKVAQMQRDWDSKEQSYQSQISTLTASKSLTANQKNFTLDVGGMSNLDYYGHVTYNMWGPFILGLQGQFGASPAAGAGLGLRF